MSNEVKLTEDNKVTTTQESNKGGNIIMDMISAVVCQEGASIELLERLLKIKEDEEEKKSKSLFLEAKSKFQMTCPIIKKRAKSHNSTYAPLGDIVKIVGPSLSLNNLSYSFNIDQVNGEIGVTCHLSHVNGHTESVTMSSPPDKLNGKNEIQAKASTVSYLQRYTFCAVTGVICVDDDTDGRTFTPCSPITVVEINNLGRSLGMSSESLVKRVSRLLNLNDSFCNIASLSQDQANEIIAILESTVSQKALTVDTNEDT